MTKEHAPARAYELAFAYERDYGCCSQCVLAAGPGQESFRQGKRVIDAFVDEFGSPLCADVQAKLMGRSFNMWDRDDFAAFEAAGGHTDKCTHVAGVAARIAAEVLFD
jgi:hypothetical protein